MMRTVVRGASPARLAALIAVVVLGSRMSAFAAKRAGVPKFEGPAEAVVRKQVMAVLKGHGYEVVKSRQMEAGLQSSGAQLEADDGFQKAAKELGLTIIVTGEVGKKKAKLSVHDGREGSLLGQAWFPGGNPRKMAGEVRRTFWAKLGKDIAKGHVPSQSKEPQVVADAPDEAESAPEPAEEDESEKASAGEDNSGSSDSEKLSGSSTEANPPSAYPVFEASAGGAGVNRQYVYNQQISGLRNHSLPLGPALALEGVWYPLGSAVPALAHLGIQGGLEQAFGVQSTIPGGLTYANTVHEYEGGLRYRIPFGGNQGWISGSGGEHAFLFTGRNRPNGSDLNVPDTIYRYARAGVGSSVALSSRVTLGFGAGYRYVFNGAGPQFKQLFPHATVGGVDAEAALAIQIMERLQVRVAGEIRRYFSSMNSKQGDLFKAGGAIDQYLSFGVGLTYTYQRSGQ
jgi:hypothetical protein